MTPLAPVSDCILIAGYYGFGNTGDEAILSALVRELHLIAPDAHLIALSGNPAETSERFDIEAFHANDADARLEAIERSRLVIIGGGGLFHDYWGLPTGTLFLGGTWGMSLFLTIALYAALRRVPMMLWALGVGPLLSDDGRAAARAICRLATVITVRDGHSRLELEAIGVAPERVIVTADPVFSTPPAVAMSPAVIAAAAQDRNGKSLLIGVCLRHWDIDVEPAFWEARVAEALDRIAILTAAAFIFIPFQSGEGPQLDDVAVARRVRSLMRTETTATILPHSLPVKETWALIGSCNFVLGMRLHAGIAAATRTTPFVMLSYDPKVSALMDELGLSEFCMDIRSVDAERLAALLLACMRDGATLLQSLGDACIRLGIRARRNAQFARALMAGTKPLSREVEFENFGMILALTLKNHVRLIAAAPAVSPVPEPTHEAEPPVAYEPLISVVLPVWNHKRFISTAIRSVLSQTWRNIELIVIDDGSDEDLSPEFESAIAGDPRARVVRRAHEGLPRSLSGGFHLATGDFLTWTSADNITRPDALASMARFLLTHPDVAMVYADMDLIDAEGNPLTGSDYRLSSQRPGVTNQLRLPRAIETLGLAEDNFIGACFLYRAGMARLLGDYDASRVGVEDYDYWLRMSLAGRIAHIDSDECLYSYRLHEDSISVRQAPDIVRDVPDLLRHHHARVEFCEGVFHVAIVADAGAAGGGRTAVNLALALRKMRHHVTEFNPADGTDAVRCWAAQMPDAKKVALFFGNTPADHPGFLSFKWVSPACDPQSVPGFRMLRSSKRIVENQWPLVPASNTEYDDLVLCMKARGTSYPMWDLPTFGHEVFLYVGPLDEACIDWTAFDVLMKEHPDAAMLFVSTGSCHRYDPRLRLPSAIYLGPRPPFHWYGYLSRAHLLIAPFVDIPETDAILSDVLMSYLAAGKPILATPVIQVVDFADLPNARIAEAARFGEASRQALRIIPDLDLASAYMKSKSPRAFAQSLLAAANNELYR